MKRTTYKKCEFCAAPLQPGTTFSVCAPCDLKMEQQDQAREAARATKWAQKHKCRLCGDGLPLSRYFECLKCKPVAAVEPESEWDGFDDMDAFGEMEAVS